MTTMRKRKSNGKSKASKIRELINKDALTPAEIANKVKVSINYVYVIKGQMKQDGFVRALPPTDPVAMPVPTRTTKSDRIEPTLEPLSAPMKIVTYPWEPPAGEPRESTLIERIYQWWKK
jgi:hypothetical protein